MVFLQKIKKKIFKRQETSFLYPSFYIKETESLKKGLKKLPQFQQILEKKYYVSIEKQDLSFSIRNFLEKKKLPPFPILRMQIEMESFFSLITSIHPKEAQKWIESSTEGKILDVRESWEHSITSLPNSIPLTAETMETILKKWNFETLILVYCHYGIRSLDFAFFLAQKGFKKVHYLQGGIHAWSIEIEGNYKTYEGHCC